MKLVPIQVKLESIYNNRHLFTDDCQNNSLVISDIVNKTVELFEIQEYHNLCTSTKQFRKITNAERKDASACFINMQGLTEFCLYKGCGGMYSIVQFNMSWHDIFDLLYLFEQKTRMIYILVKEPQ